MDEDDIYRWNLALIVLNPDSLYYGGYFKAQFKFPSEYPYTPPGKSHHSTLLKYHMLTSRRLPVPPSSVAP